MSIHINTDGGLRAGDDGSNFDPLHSTQKISVLLLPTNPLPPCWPFTSLFHAACIPALPQCSVDLYTTLAAPFLAQSDLCRITSLAVVKKSALGTTNPIQGFCYGRLLAFRRSCQLSWASAPTNRTGASSSFMTGSSL